MSDTIRTALIGGGTINISIKTDTSGDFRLEVVESWARLTGIQSAVIPAADLDASSDPDGLLRSKLEELTHKHINWRVTTPLPEPEPLEEIESAPGDDIIAALLGFSDYKPRSVPATWWERTPPKPVRTPAEELVHKVRAGLRVSLLPLGGTFGTLGGVQVRMECINTAYAAGRLMNRSLSGEKLTEAADPVGLVGQTVYELSRAMYGPA